MLQADAMASNSISARVRGTPTSNESAEAPFLAPAAKRQKPAHSALECVPVVENVLSYLTPHERLMFRGLSRKTDISTRFVWRAFSRNVPTLPTAHMSGFECWEHDVRFRQTNSARDMWFERLPTDSDHARDFHPHVATSQFGERAQVEPNVARLLDALIAGARLPLSRITVSWPHDTQQPAGSFVVHASGAVDALAWLEGPRSGLLLHYAGGHSAVLDFSRMRGQKNCGL